MLQFVQNFHQFSFLDIHGSYEPLKTQLLATIQADTTWHSKSEHFSFHDIEGSLLATHRSLISDSSVVKEEPQSDEEGPSASPTQAPPPTPEPPQHIKCPLVAIMHPSEDIKDWPIIDTFIWSASGSSAFVKQDLTGSWSSDDKPLVLSFGPIKPILRLQLNR